MTLSVFIAALVIMTASFSGKLFASRYMHALFEKNATFFTSFSLGIFIAVSYALFQESFHEGMRFSEIFFYALVGVLILEAFSHLIPGAHHHHTTEHEHHPHSRLDARRILFGHSLHNIGDGLILVPAFALDTTLGIITALGIFIHEVVQEIAQFFILRKAGSSVNQALLYNVATSATILIGVSIGLWASATSPLLETSLLPIAAGGFLAVVFRDLLPDTWHVARCTKRYARYTLAILLGLLLMFLLRVVFPHEHESPRSSDAAVATLYPKVKA